jgi:hypothetical protein
MIRQDIDIMGYWTIIIVYDVYLGEENSGFTHTNFNKRLSIVGIGKADSKKQFLNTIVHEAKHIQSHICMYYDVPEDSEDAAYLIGYIVMKMYDCFKQYLCQ